ncbi:MAG TPA: N-6 DNA methylase [Dyadobacter sp.]|jgi:adenine-specific DNA-methyltransferase|nr:N-6 DNA methylase [Dyadobacter sp.]
MASKTRIFEKRKLLGQIYTPSFVVEKMLQDTGFYALSSEKISILDPACGDGRFLVPIAEYYIKTTPEEKLKDKLERIEGWDIDPAAIALCRENLNALLDGISIPINWNLKRKDALRGLNARKKYDLIVGNPPYVRIQNVAPQQRKFVQDNYSFCKSGSTDIYVAFFQLAHSLLKVNGLCALVTSNSFLTSQTALSLRAFFGQSRVLKQITNYGTQRIFDNTGTYAAITIFGNVAKDEFSYELVDPKDITRRRNIHCAEIADPNQWHLSVDQAQKMDGIRLGDLCQISIGLSTLADHIYLLKPVGKGSSLTEAITKTGHFLLLENDILKPIIKGSKLKSSGEPITEMIIFPYEKDQKGKFRIIPEPDLAARFPRAYNYLLSMKSELLNRDNGKINSVSWYAFGRSQGLDSAFGRKIIFSPINNYPNFILYDNPDCTVYSGYFLKFSGDYEKLLQQLNSQRMADFVAVAGRDFQGGYKGYNKKVIENFIVADLTADCDQSPESKTADASI